MNHTPEYTFKNIGSFFDVENDIRYTKKQIQLLKNIYQNIPEKERIHLAIDLLNFIKYTPPEDLKKRLKDMADESKKYRLNSHVETRNMTLYKLMYGDIRWIPLYLNTGFYPICKWRLEVHSSKDI